MTKKIYVEKIEHLKCDYCKETATHFILQDNCKIPVCDFHLKEVVKNKPIVYKMLGCDPNTVQGIKGIKSTSVRFEISSYNEIDTLSLVNLKESQILREINKVRDSLF